MFNNIQELSGPSGALKVLEAAKIFDFLVQHYVANDVVIYGDARAELLAAHPELGDEQKLAEDENLRKQRDSIENLCSVKQLTALETSYFNFFTPFQLPDISKYNPHYLALCVSMERILRKKIEENKINLNDYDVMVSAWENSLAEAINLPCPYTQRRGLDKLVNIYNLHRLLSHSEERPLRNDFVDLVCQKELEFFTEIYKKSNGVN